VIREGDKIKTVRSKKAGRIGNAKLWGVFHEECFLDSVRSPQAAVQRMQLLEESYGRD